MWARKKPKSATSHLNVARRHPSISSLAGALVIIHLQMIPGGRPLPWLQSSSFLVDCCSHGILSTKMRIYKGASDSSAS